MADLPPIVLLVEDDPETQDLYEAAFGSAGLWVATSVDADDALEYALDLGPDSVVMDIAIPAVGDGLGLVRALRENARFAETPIVAVTGLAAARLEVDAELFTTIFYKPVRLDQMVRRVKWLSHRSAVLRDRSEAARARVPGLLARSNALFSRSIRLGEERRGVVSDRSAAEAAAADPPEVPTVRSCPKCRKALLFSERRPLDGTTFDYYAPCRNGCGLFFYDHSRRKMISLLG